MPNQQTTNPTLNLVEAIDDVMRRHFRTEHDTGANSTAMLVMNTFRSHAGLPSISKRDLPKWDEGRKAYIDPATKQPV